MAAMANDRLKKTLSRKSVLGVGPLTFEALLGNRASLLFFERFCVDDASTENLLFWLELQDIPEFLKIVSRMSQLLFQLFSIRLMIQINSMMLLLGQPIMIHHHQMTQFWHI